MILGAVRDIGQAVRMQILIRTRGQRDSWQQKTKTVRYLSVRSGPLDRKQEQKMSLVDGLQRPNDPLDSLVVTMS